VDIATGGSLASGVATSGEPGARRAEGRASAGAQGDASVSREGASGSGALWSDAGASTAPASDAAE
jgi:hypothetical protein